jgi:hypothetical protein
MSTSVVLSLIWLMPNVAAAGRNAAPALRLAEPVELMKLSKDQVPALSFGEPFVRVSPKADRCVYLRKRGEDYKFMLYIRTFGPPAAEHEVLAAVPAVPWFWLWGFSGRCWRADGMQVAYLLAGSKDGMADEDVRYRLGAARFDWTLPVPQQSGGGIAKGAKRSHTAVTFGHTGTACWRAESDLREYSSCRVVGPKGVLYEGKGFAIHHLVASPDGRHMAWVELPPRKRRRRPAAAPAAREAKARAGLRGRTPAERVPPCLVVMNIAAGKIVHRIRLPRFPGDPPVWAAGGKVLCYSRVAEINRVFRREIQALDLAGGNVHFVARDAKAVGAVGGCLIANRGPACIPMMQHSSSYRPPPGTDDRPKNDAIVLCRLAEDAQPVVLLRGAFAQEVLGRKLIYAEENGPDVIVWKAALK